MIRCENVFLFSVLHLAVEHGREQLVSDLLELIKQLPPTTPPLIDCASEGGHVSDS